MNQKHIIITIFLFQLLIQTKSQQFSENLSPNSLGFEKEKLTHLHFYFHEVISGRPPTVVQVAEAATTNSSKTGFGTTYVADNPLTVGPELTSKIVGRGQGMSASADLNDFGYLWVFNLVFGEGKYNGSTLSLLGRNAVLAPVREMSIVGGTGFFRFARGYALTKTQFSNPSNGDSTVEYDVFVIHY
uniref:dirigent protein 21-like n=1 Tax=Erigeron canadensis TaxID=72917 RepID=UPI001CB9BD5B|nr:dirigent protein 21-like [Erigeron canadensis]